MVPIVAGQPARRQAGHRAARGDVPRSPCRRSSRRSPGLARAAVPIDAGKPVIVSPVVTCRGPRGANRRDGPQGSHVPPVVSIVAAVPRARTCRPSIDAGQPVAPASWSSAWQRVEGFPRGRAAVPVAPIVADNGRAVEGLLPAAVPAVPSIVAGKGNAGQVGHRPGNVSRAFPRGRVARGDVPRSPW